jgi:hypothetical protein
MNLLLAKHSGTLCVPANTQIHGPTAPANSLQQTRTASPPRCRDSGKLGGRRGVKESIVAGVASSIALTELDCVRVDPFDPRTGTSTCSYSVWVSVWVSVWSSVWVSVWVCTGEAE